MIVHSFIHGSVMTATLDDSSHSLNSEDRWTEIETSNESLTSRGSSDYIENRTPRSCSGSPFYRNKWGMYLFPRTKPTILVLLWMFCAYISIGSIFTLILHETQQSFTSFVCLFGANVIVMLSVPVAGFLADAYWGRFRLIIFGLLSGWLTLVAAWIGILYIATVGKDSLLPLLVYMVPACGLLIVTTFFGIPGFFANIIQFGVDQLPYAPSEEINIYIHWIVWAKILGGTVADITLPLILAGMQHVSLNWERVIPLTLMGLLVVITGAVFLVSAYGRHWFHTEFKGQNMYSHIWRVVNFARKNKVPVCRSALTYCENDVPSRMDLGKTKYGGPFTTEQVEDVKTFLRMFGLLLITCPFFAIYVILFYDPPGSYSIPVCTRELRYASVLVTVITQTLVVPINILVVYPICRNYYPGALKRMGIGMVLILSAVLIKLIITLISVHTIQHQPEEYANCTTVFQNASQGFVVFVPGFLTGTSLAVFYPAFYGFICAQSPQSMMGILIGVSFVIKGVFMLIGNAFVLPALIWKSNLALEWVTFLICFLFGAGGLFLYTAVARLYKFRERDEKPNDQLYVETYYNKMINRSSTQ